MNASDFCEPSPPQNTPEDLISFPVTPLHPSARPLHGNTLWYKRDDLLPYAFGGNKVRIAAAFFRDMRRHGATSIVGYGNVRSNLSRALSWMARRFGVRCDILSPYEEVPSEAPESTASSDAPEPDDMTFNRRLTLLCGAHIVPCPKKAVAPCVEATMNRLREEGERPYYIYGDKFGQGNEAVPAAPYVDVFREWSKQADALSVSFEALFLPCGTGATLAGLLYGKFLTASPVNIVGISVARDTEKASAHVRTALERLGEAKGRPVPEDWINQHLHIDDRYIAGGYGHYNAPILDAIREALTVDGIPLDPTYTGKAWWGMSEYVKQHGLEGKSIAFLHTGGLPLFFDLMRTLDKKQEIL